MATRVELLILAVLLAITVIGVEGKRRGKIPKLKELRNGELACRPRKCPDGSRAIPPFCQCEECPSMACPHGERYDERKCDCVPGCFLETCPLNQVLDSDLCRCVADEENIVENANAECLVPDSGCPIAYQWDMDLCRCIELRTTQHLYDDNVICEMPGNGCEHGYVWNAIQCQCRWVESGLSNTDEFCSNPQLTCPTNQKWDKDLCECRPVEAICKPKRCRNDRQWDSNRCKCVRLATIIAEEMIEPHPCVLPAEGCREGYYFDREFCQCRTSSYY